MHRQVEVEPNEGHIPVLMRRQGGDNLEADKVPVASASSGDAPKSGA